MESTYKVIDYHTAINFLLPRHYSGRKPQITYAFGEYEDNILVAVCTFGMPASNYLCTGVCGEEYKTYVLELNRLCRLDEYHGILSKFVAYCLSQLGDKIIVSYSDTAMNHHGYIYQALNFIYTGKTKQRTDKYTQGNKHSRHYNNDEQLGLRKVRSAKYRYVLFIGNKRFKKQARKHLQYPIFNEYPKGNNNINYTLGEYLQPILVKDKKVDM